MSESCAASAPVVMMMVRMAVAAIDDAPGRERSGENEKHGRREAQRESAKAMFQDEPRSE
jgi:hypothetical protein